MATKPPTRSRIWPSSWIRKIIHMGLSMIHGGSPKFFIWHFPQQKATSYGGFSPMETPTDSVASPGSSGFAGFPMLISQHFPHRSCGPSPGSPFQTATNSAIRRCFWGFQHLFLGQSKVVHQIWLKPFFKPPRCLFSEVTLAASKVVDILRISLYVYVCIYIYILCIYIYIIYQLMLLHIHTWWFIPLSK